MTNGTPIDERFESGDKFHGVEDSSLVYFPVGIVIDSKMIEAFMDMLTIFGLLSVTAMLVFYALEKRSHWCILGFAGSCVLGSFYGFLQGAWPFGIIEAIWSIVAARRWWITKS